MLNDPPTNTVFFPEAITFAFASLQEGCYQRCKFSQPDSFQNKQHDMCE